MPIPTNVFRNILRLEEHKEFADASVQGGLEAFARRWSEQIVSAERGARAMSEAIAGAFDGYAAAAPGERESAIRRANELLALFDEGVRVVPGTNGHKAGKNGASGNGHAAHGIEGFTGFDDTDPRAKAPISSSRSGIAQAPVMEAPAAPPKSARAARRSATLDSPVTVLRGVQDATARLLKRLGVYTVRDALLFFPFRYDDFSEMKPISELRPDVNQTVVGTIWSVEVKHTRNGRPMVTATISDDSGIILVTWFNQEYIARQLHQGEAIVISGKPVAFNGRLQFSAPEWEPYDSELLH
ncbi:MAG: ATP-dependent helicase RecG, partial [Chloroflexia bacterium]|nr:ATP-dependent helicase RecG [Chloroflexia bacterium]